MSLAACAARRAADSIAEAKTVALSSNVSTLIAAAISESTRRNYAASQARFTSFCRARGRGPLPIDSDLLVQWLASESETGKMARTIGTYRSAISTMHEE